MQEGSPHDSTATRQQGSLVSTSQFDLVRKIRGATSVAAEIDRGAAATIVTILTAVAARAAA